MENSSNASYNYNNLKFSADVTVCPSTSIGFDVDGAHFLLLFSPPLCCVVFFCCCSHVRRKSSTKSWEWVREREARKGKITRSSGRSAAMHSQNLTRVAVRSCCCCCCYSDFGWLCRSNSKKRKVCNSRSELLERRNGQCVARILLVFFLSLSFFLCFIIPSSLSFPPPSSPFATPSDRWTLFDRCCLRCASSLPNNAKEWEKAKRRREKLEQRKKMRAST